MRITSLRISVALVTFLSWWVPLGTLQPATAFQRTEGGRNVRRFDPVNDRYVAVPADELRIGFIYSHFDQRLDRRVWAFYQGDGRFSIALGEGSIQRVYRLDIRATQAEAVQALRRIAPRMAEAIEKPGGGGSVWGRINADNEWELYGVFGVPSIFNPETGRRWAKQGREYIPVSHTSGYRWRAQDGKLVPVTSTTSWLYHGH